jgi:hypothetical protein
MPVQHASAPPAEQQPSANPASPYEPPTMVQQPPA